MNMTANQEIRMRCLEAAAKNPVPHADGYAAGVLEAAQQYSAWVEQSVEITVLSVKPARVDTLF